MLTRCKKQMFSSVTCFKW